MQEMRRHCSQKLSRALALPDMRMDLRILAYGQHNLITSYMRRVEQGVKGRQSIMVDRIKVYLFRTALVLSHNEYTQKQSELLIPNSPGSPTPPAKKRLFNKKFQCW